MLTNLKSEIIPSHFKCFRNMRSSRLIVKSCRPLASWPLSKWWTIKLSLDIMQPFHSWRIVREKPIKSANIEKAQKYQVTLIKRRHIYARRNIRKRNVLIKNDLKDKINDIIYFRWNLIMSIESEWLWYVLLCWPWLSSCIQISLLCAVNKFKLLLKNAGFPLRVRDVVWVAI